MNFNQYEQQLNDLQTNSITRFANLIEDMLALIRNGHGDDPHIDALKDDADAIWTDYKAQEQRLMEKLIGINNE